MQPAALTPPPHGSKSRAFALGVLTLALLPAVAVFGVLMFPFAIAEPGQPDGVGPFVLWWSIGELAWTWWALAVRTPPQLPAAHRWQAVAVVIALVAVGATIGLRLTFVSSAYEASCWVAAATTTAGCRLGRWRLGVASPPSSVDWVHFFKWTFVLALLEESILAVTGAFVRTTVPNPEDLDRLFRESLLAGMAVVLSIGLLEFAILSRVFLKRYHEKKVLLSCLGMFVMFLFKEGLFQYVLTSF